jgi:choline dehydrogenase-like flavoprotein
MRTDDFRCTVIWFGRRRSTADHHDPMSSIDVATVAHSLDDIGSWWSQVDRRRTNLMTVHLTSSIRMGEDPAGSAADSFGRVRGASNLRVNDASLLPDAPGVNPQAAIMTIALRNAEQFLTTLP